MATAYLTVHVELPLTNNTPVVGSITTPVQVTVGGQYHHRNITLATATTATIYDATTDSPSSFDFIVILSDQDVFLETVVDQNGGVGTEQLAYKLRANLPFILPYDDAKANYTINFAAGTNDVIDLIRIRNESGSTANIEYLVVT